MGEGSLLMGSRLVWGKAHFSSPLLSFCSQTLFLVHTLSCLLSIGTHQHHLGWVYTCACMSLCTRYSVHVEVRGQCEGVGSFLPPFRVQGSNSDVRLGRRHLHLLSHLTGPHGAILRTGLRLGTDDV